MGGLWPFTGLSHFETEPRQFQKPPPYILFGIPQYVCPEGWVKHKDNCMFSSTQAKSWSKARKLCLKNEPQGKLIEIHSAEENTVLTELVNGTNFEYWIGLKDLHRRYTSNRAIVWNSTNSEIRYLYNNFKTNTHHVREENCGFLDDRGLWYLTKSCDLKKRFLCQKKTDCLNGYYGQLCSERCHCYKADCDRNTGKCPYGCSRGWMGENCNEKKGAAEIAVYCVEEKNSDKHALVRVDLKGVSYDEIYLLDETGAIACKKSLFNPDTDGIYNINITIYSNGTTNPDCSPKHTSEELFEWTLRTEEFSGFLSDYDRKFQVKCNFNRAEKLFRQKNQPVSRKSTINLVEKEVKQTTENVKLIVQDPSTKEPISRINIGSKIQIAMVLDTHNTSVSAKGIFPYNCSCSTSDGKITRYLTDSTGCPLKNSPIVSLEEQGSPAHLISNAFDAFTIEGRSDVVFHCQFRFCFETFSLSECSRFCGESVELV
ncbi:hypothetical protein LOTGIDRAFT_235529 [Lottia gigantea]|uniref:C-type lectin domain-containing protein n=1 Tax=Lottia gigantea TaxID=225164 RepID=V4BAZ8_LOTGI|nr:hypothetical protein LOTGIDRAFT_235529 [Lottia gigantea]ESO86154.1 hypothetical protein LOTGIDRAFT_235529 [Lottia gigantea]